MTANSDSCASGSLSGGSGAHLSSSTAAAASSVSEVSAATADAAASVSAVAAASGVLCRGSHTCS